MHRGKIGILGGMGPAAGTHFAQRLIALNTAARQDADHVAFVLYSETQIPSRVDSYLKNAASPVPRLISALRNLAACGADFGVMVCNTAHIYFDEIADAVDLPLVHMIESTANHVEHLPMSRRRVGLLATEATVKSGLYQRYFDASATEVIVPSDDDQALVTAAIFDPEHGVKATGMTVSDAARRMLAVAAYRLRQRAGIQHLVLGCTELSFAIPSTAWEGFQVIDPVNVLAQACLARTRIARRPADMLEPA